MKASLQRYAKATLVALGIAALLQLSSMAEVRIGDTAVPSALFDLSHLVVHLSMAPCLAFATLWADDAIERGARPFWAYSWSVAGGTAVGSLLQFTLHRGFGLADALSGATPWPVLWSQPLRVFLLYLLWSAALTFAYASLRADWLAGARLKNALLDRERLQQRTLESRLQALQARVEPGFLFSTLSRVRELCLHDAAQGSRMLDDLVAYLRAALPQWRDSSSTVAQELELAKAYLAIRVAQPAALDAALDTLPLRMPPLVLLPVIDWLLRSAPWHGGRCEIVVRRNAGVLELSVACAGAHGYAAAASGALLQPIRERLHLLYGDAGRLTVQAQASGQERVLLSLPDEGRP